MKVKLFLLTLLSLTTVLIKAQTFPVMNPIAGPPVVCSSPSAPKSFTAFASGVSNTYFWSVLPASGVTYGSVNASVTSISFPNTNTTFTISCYASNLAGISLPVSFVVTVFETPQVTFSGANVFCQGSSTRIQASPTTFAASSTISYSWAPSIGLSSPTVSNPIAGPTVSITYTVTYALGACTNSSQVAITVNPCVGLNKINSLEGKNTLLVYPNPNNGSFYIKSDFEKEILIFDITGKLIKKVKLEKDKETSINGLGVGIYFVADEQRRKKIIVTQ
jgi:hypothetical protein